MATDTERRIYTPEFKADAVQLHRDGQSLLEVAAALDVPEPLVRTWVLLDDAANFNKPRVQAQPAPAAAPAAAAPAALPAWAKRCMVCGRGPALDVRLRTVTGMVIAFRMRRINGAFCRDCGVAMARRTLNRTLLTGWWGLFAGIANLYASIVDATALGRFRRSPEPAGEPTAPPLPPGQSVFKRAGVYVGGVVMALSLLLSLAFVGTAVGPSLLNGKCVAFKQTRVVPTPSCGDTHDGRVIAVVSNRTVCPAATDATIRLKTAGSRLLCIDLDQ